MRKLFYLILLCIVTVLVTSCEKRMEDSIVGEDHTYSEVVELQNRIDSIAVSMSFAPEIQTRGLSSWLVKIGATVLADAVSGIVASGLSSGNVYIGYGVAIAASTLVATLSVDRISFLAGTRATTDNERGILEMNPEGIAMSGVLPIERYTQSLNMQSDSIGYYHNLIIMEMADTLSAMDTISTDCIITLTADALGKYFDVNNEEIKTALNSYSEPYVFIENNYCRFGTCESTSDIIDIWENKYPNRNNELSLIEAFMNGLVNIQVRDNDGAYLSNVLYALHTSNLDAQMKVRLRNAFIVANASYQLWNTEEL